MAWPRGHENDDVFSRFLCSCWSHLQISILCPFLLYLQRAEGLINERIQKRQRCFFHLQSIIFCMGYHMGIYGSQRLVLHAKIPWRFRRFVYRIQRFSFRTTRSLIKGVPAHYNGISCRRIVYSFFHNAKEWFHWNGITSYCCRLFIRRSLLIQCLGSWISSCIFTRYRRYHNKHYEGTCGIKIQKFNSHLFCTSYVNLVLHKKYHTALLHL